LVLVKFITASVQAAPSSRLDAGSWLEEGNTITLDPPVVALFDQITEWLWRQAPPPDPVRLDIRMTGVGAAALCLFRDLLLPIKNSGIRCSFYSGGLT
jgi:hypothetical protein